jgi:hypothetical protein
MINDTTALTAAEQLIESLTLDIDCMNRDIDSERKAKGDDIKMFTEWLDRMIEMETTIPTGPSNAHVYEGCKKYFIEMVAK